MPKRAIAPIEQPPIRLRLLNENDLPATLVWRNQEHIRKWFVYSAIITPEQHRTWFEKYTLKDNDFVFIIEETQALNRPVGQISLYDINWEHKRAEYGRLMIGDPAARGKGLAKAATMLLLDFGFDSLGLHEIVLEVFEDNLAAYNLYAACGFIPVGKKDNLILMSITKSTGI
jgi:diamine N-acetyltransferase